MKRDFNTNTDNSQEWLTPPEIIEALGDFDLDPCFPEKAPWPIAKHRYTKKQDGLQQEWFGRVWLNPPYGRETFKWLQKLRRHGNGIALIFARTETKGFHREVWEFADGVFFFEGRLRFYKPTGEQGGRANAPSCLIAYGEENYQFIKESGLKGRLVALEDWL